MFKEKEAQIISIGKSSTIIPTKIDDSRLLRGAAPADPVMQEKRENILRTIEVLGKPEILKVINPETMEKSIVSIYPKATGKSFEQKPLFEEKITNQ